MNDLQEMIFEMLVKMYSAKRLEDFWTTGDIRYGVLNYVARFSLANDFYLVTEKSKAFLDEKGFLKAGRLLRSKKSRKNGFTFEHVIPSNVVADELFRNRQSVEAMRDILVYSNIVTVLTDDEDRLLREKYVSKMPEGWVFLNSSPFARYVECGLVDGGLEESVQVYGAITR